MPDTKFMGFKPAQKVYFITGEYPNENYDSGHIKLLFESFRENIPWAALTVFPMQQLNKPCAELFLTSADAKNEIERRRDEIRAKYYAETGETLADLAKFMVTHDCVTGNDPIARSVALDRLEHFGIEVIE